MAIKGSFPLAIWMLTSLVFITVTGSQENCGALDDCLKCISAPIGCGWCVESTPGQSKCLGKDELKKCATGHLQNPRSDYSKKDEEYFSNNPLMEITPKTNAVRIRAGDTVEVPLHVKISEAQPVDFYYLTDISDSMKDDMHSISQIASSLGYKLKNLTSELRVGFGTFVDKMTLPYYDVHVQGSQPKSPHCEGAIGFCNAMALDDYDADTFKDVVNKTKVITNKDSPEGGFDALLQALVCKQIRWEDNARKILLFTTDAPFHYAGDGKLAGLSKMNDGLCHYDDRTNSYSMSQIMDYPSVYQISSSAKKSKVNIVFAVTENVRPLYEELAVQVHGARTTVIEKDSSNILGVIEQVVQEITDKFTFEAVKIDEELPEELSVSFTNNCPGNSANEICQGLKIGQNATVTAKIKLKACPARNDPDKQIIFKVGSTELDAFVNVTLHYLCDCDCASNSRKECSDFGKYDCGKCICDEGYFGTNCSCTKDSEQSENACRVSDDGKVCAGRGQCLCGECHCDTFFYDGQEHKYCSSSMCSTSDVSCGPTKDNLCNNNGVCKCGECVCHEGYSGTECDCPLSTDKCERDGLMCSDHGECTCNKCKCKLREGQFWYYGERCEKCRTCGDMCSGANSLLPCVLYHWRDNVTEFEVAEANVDSYRKACKYKDIEYHIESDSKITELKSHMSECEAKDNTEKCVKKFWYDQPEADQKYIVYYTSDPAQCESSNTYIIISIVAGIVLLALVCVLSWFGYRCLRNRREVEALRQHFESEAPTVHSNPEYRNPNYLCENPTFTSEQKPGSSQQTSSF